MGRNSPHLISSQRSSPAVRRPGTSLVRSPPGHSSGVPSLTVALWRLLPLYAWLGRLDLEGRHVKLLLNSAASSWRLLWPDA
jgi:hypothetical protein